MIPILLPACLSIKKLGLETHAIVIDVVVVELGTATLHITILRRGKDTVEIGCECIVFVVLGAGERQEAVGTICLI